MTFLPQNILRWQGVPIPTGVSTGVMKKTLLMQLAVIGMFAPVIALLTWLLWLVGMPWRVGLTGGLIWAIAIFTLVTAQPRRS